MAGRTAKRHTAEDSDESTAKTKILHIRVSIEEKKVLQRLADAEGDTVSHFVRKAMRRIASGWKLVDVRDNRTFP